MKNNNNNTFPSHNVISTNSILRGQIESANDFRIDGVVYGDINIFGDLIVGHSGKIKGKIISKNLEVYGEIEGELKIEETTILKNESILIGNLETKKIIIEDGAKFDGNCKTTL